MKAPKTYLVEIVPISKAGLFDRTTSSRTLSYFSSIKILPGTLVRVPLRNSLVPAVVVNTKSAMSAKSDIRRAGFALKKIAQKNILRAGLSPEFLSAVQETATYYAATLSSLLLLLLPKMLLEEPEKFLPAKARSAPGGKEISQKETLLIQMETVERFGHLMD